MQYFNRSDLSASVSFNRCYDINYECFSHSNAMLFLSVFLIVRKHAIFKARCTPRCIACKSTVEAEFSSSPLLTLAQVSGQLDAGQSTTTLPRRLHQLRKWNS